MKNMQGGECRPLVQKPHRDHVSLLAIDCMSSRTDSSTRAYCRRRSPPIGPVRNEWDVAVAYGNEWSDGSGHRVWGGALSLVAAAPHSCGCPSANVAALAARGKRLGAVWKGLVSYGARPVGSRHCSERPRCVWAGCSSMPWRCAAASSISVYLYCPARDSADTTPHRWMSVKSP